MTEASTTTEQEVLEGAAWLTKLLGKFKFEKGAYTSTGVCTRTVLSDTSVKLPGLDEVVEIPEGTKVTFFQSYPPKSLSTKALAIFLQKEQITIHGNGRVSRRIH